MNTNSDVPCHPVRGDHRRASRRLLVALVIIAFGSLGQYASLRAGSDMLVAGAIGWVWVMAGVVLAVFAMRKEGQTWSDVGLGRPRSVWRTILTGVLLAVVLVVGGSLLLTLVVMPLLGAQAPDSSRFELLRGNAAVLVVGLFSVWTAAAFGEEFMFRGFLMRRIADCAGGKAVGWGVAAVVSSVLFGLLHFYQGLAGMVITGIIGLLIAVAFLSVKRNLWAVIIAHGLVDTVSFVSIYLS